MIATGHLWTGRALGPDQHTTMLIVVLFVGEAALLLAHVAKPDSPLIATSALLFGLVSLTAMPVHALLGPAWLFLPLALAFAFLLFRTFKSEWGRLQERFHRGDEHPA